jgi:alcohol dehydrogenase
MDKTIKRFKFSCYPEVIYGKNSISQLPLVIKEFNKNRLLLVTDKNFGTTSIFKEITKMLENENIDFRVFDDISGEPSTETGDQCASFGKTEGCDIICGIGGGSVLDTAKAVSVLITNGGSVRDYQGLNKVPGPGLPKIMVPTTAGTGSEVTFTAVFIRRDEKKKGGINSPFLYADISILDPLLTISLPSSVTASTGLDALCHAVESYLSKKSTFMSKTISMQAIKLIWANLPIVFEDGNNVNARDLMLYGSFLAGIGLANAGVTAVHSISYPLGGVFNVPHGIGNGLLLPYVLEFEKEEISKDIAEIDDCINKKRISASDMLKTEAFISEIKNFLKIFNIPTLKEFNIGEDSFANLAKDALQVSVPIENNPKPVTEEDIIEIYKKAL